MVREYGIGTKEGSREVSWSEDKKTSESKVGPSLILYLPFCGV